MMMLGGYLLCMLVFSGATNMLLTIVLLELLSWMFVMIMPAQMTFMYLIIQTYFVFMSFMLLSISSTPLLWFMLLKTGLPPFHAWILSTLIVLDIYTLMFMTLPHKLLPLMLMSKLTMSPLINSLIMVMTFSSIMIFQLSSYFQVIMFSSMVHTMWMLFSIMFSMCFFLLYWFIYMMIMVVLMMSASIKKTMWIVLNQTILSQMVWLIMSGIPPFSIFWVKAEIMTNALLLKLIVLAPLLVLASVLSLSAYYRISHLIINNNMQPKQLLLPLALVASTWTL